MFLSLDTEDKKKNQEWLMSCIKQICENKSNNKEYLQSCYDLYNNIILENQYDIHTKVFGHSLPGVAKRYPLIRPYIDFLLGEESKRSFDFVAIATNKDAVDKKIRDKNIEIFKFLNNKINESLKYIEQQQQTAPDLYRRESERIISELEQLEVEMKDGFKLKCEEEANKLLEHLKFKCNLERIFLEGLRDQLICGQQFYHVPENPLVESIRCVNPINFYRSSNSDKDDISDVDWVCEDRYMTLSDIFQLFGDELTIEQRNKLENKYKIINSNYNSNAPLTLAKNTEEKNEYSSYNYYNNYNNYNNLICVKYVQWKAQRKLNIKHSINEYDDRIIHYKITNPNKLKKNDKVEYRYVTDIYEGYKIDEDIYVGLKRRNTQPRPEDNPSITKLNYTGIIYNSRNSESYSLVGQLKPFQELYDIINLHKEIALGTSGAKGLVVDMAQQDPNFDIGTTLYRRKLGLVLINSAANGDDVAISRGHPNYMQPFDDTLSQQQIAALTEMSQECERIVEKITGIPKERLGAIEPRAGKGVTERSIAQSSIATELQYSYHDEAKRRVLELMNTFAVNTIPDTYSASYIFNEYEIRNIQIQKEDLQGTNFGVFIVNSSKHAQSLDELKQLSIKAVENPQIDLAPIVELWNTNNISEFSRKLKRNLDKKNKLIEEQSAKDREAQQQAQQQQSQIAQQQLQQQADLDNKKLMLEENKIQLDSKKLELEQVKVESTNQANKELEVLKSENRLKEIAMENENNSKNEQNKLMIEHEKELNNMQLELTKLQESINQERESLDSQYKIKMMELEGKLKESEQKHQLEIQKLKLEEESNRRKNELELQFMMEEHKLKIQMIQQEHQIKMQQMSEKAQIDSKISESKMQNELEKHQMDIAMQIEKNEMKEETENNKDVKK